MNAADGLLVDRIEPGIVEIRLDRPERRNALTEEMMVSLMALGSELSADPSVTAVLLTASGAGFCAGADRGVVASRRGTYLPHRWPAPMGREAELLSTYEMPIVAVVQGAAVGLGMGLALAADICVVEKGAYFTEAHLALGLCPTAMCWWLPRNCGLQRAADIVLTGRRVEAEEAVRIGMVAAGTAAGAGRERALTMARNIAAMPPHTVRYAKLAMQTAQDQESMQRVRHLGGSANIIGRLVAQPSS
jgi:enoyl-CoA hydratase